MAESRVSTKLEILAEFPKAEPIVGLVQWEGRLFMATSCRLFEYTGDRLEEVRFSKNG